MNKGMIEQYGGKTMGGDYYFEGIRYHYKTSWESNDRIDAFLRDIAGIYGNVISERENDNNGNLVLYFSTGSKR